VEGCAVVDVVVAGGLTCSDLSCDDGERCLMNVPSATPVCVPCDRACVRSSRRPVCGSDGSTYQSHCHLIRAACRRGVVIDASHAGRCDTGTCIADCLISVHVVHVEWLFTFHRRRRGGREHWGTPPPPNSGEKVFFGQTSHNIRAVDIFLEEGRTGTL